MRYATVVVQRLIARALDDWNRRSLEHPAEPSQDRRSWRAVESILRLALARLTAHLVAFVRFLAVASPPIDAVADRPAPVRPARPRLPGAYPLTPAARERAAEVAAASTPVPVRPAVVSRVTTVPAPRRVRDASVHGMPPAPRPAHVHPLIAWMRPFAALLVPSRRSATGGSDPAGSHPGSMSWAAQQRVLGGAVAVLVLVASIVGVSPVHTPVGGTGNVLGAGAVPRTVIGGGSSGASSGDANGQPDDGTPVNPVAAAGNAAALASTQSQDGATPNIDLGTDLPDIEAFTDTPGSNPEGFQRPADPLPTVVTQATEMGAYLADGTILKPIAVDTTVPDARTLLTRYKVRKGDTLTSIAHSYGLSLVTLYWANHLTTNLKSKTDLKVGQVLSIPPVNGVLHIVTDKETLQDIAKRTKVSASKIVAANGLKQPTVYVGQWIIIPGAKAKPIPVPAAKPVARPTTTTTASKPTTTTRPTSRPAPKPVTRPTYTGGGWVWPAPGGHISQYYHYGHWAIDIADDYGAPVLAAKAGVVIFAGWRNNGGGWQVWMSHGNGIYTTYNHMSSLTVGTGQVVAAGRQVGRIGMTGHATGPHLHFEVWIGPIWAGGTRQNPLNYV